MNKRRKWIRVLRWILFIAVLWGLVQYVLSHRTDFQAIQNISFGLILFILCLRTGLIFVSAVQMFAVVRALGLNIDFGRWVKVFAYSRIINRIYPQAGNVYRAAELKFSYSFALSDYVAAFAVFLYLDRVITLALLLITVMLVEPKLTVFGWNVALLSSALLFALIVIPMIVYSQKSAVQQKFQKPSLSRHLVRIFNRMTIVLRSPRLVSLLLGLGVFMYFAGLYINALCFNALGTPLGMAQLGVLRFVKSGIDVVSLTPGNIGITELGYGLLCKSMQVSISSGIITAAVLNVTGLLSAAIMAVVVMAIYGRQSLYRHLQNNGKPPANK